jgi:hypothetical protein
MVVFPVALDEVRADVIADLPGHLGQVPDHLSGRHFLLVFLIMVTRCTWRVETRCPPRL